MKSSLSFLLALLLAPLPLIGDNAQAFAALQHGRVAEAQQLLRNPQDANAHQLLCRIFYAQDQAARAVPECEAAVAAAPNDATNQLWLGRAYGMKARHASPLTAFSLARKVHTAFERALQLAPANQAALNDLGEFYVAAPAIVGGGLDKARALADTTQPQSPAAAHRLRAYIANKQNDDKAAESEFQAEAAIARTAAAYIDLAQFYQQHKRTDEAEATLRQSIDRNVTRDAALVDAASILTELNRAPDLAEKCLRAYLASPTQTDDAPVFKVHLQLGHLLAQHGDLSGARREYAAALALAPDFLPARQAAAPPTGTGG